MSGHIEIAGKPYMLELENYQRALANPFAAKLGTGAGDYNDLDDWAAWVMDNWQAGVGQKDPVAGGFLYGAADTRFPGQMTLAPLVTMTGLSAAGIRQPGAVTTTLVTDSTDNQRYGSKFTAPVTETVTSVWVLIEAGVAITLGIYSDSSGPNALVGTGGAVTTGETTPGYHWVEVAVSAALTATTDYWLVVYPTTGTDVLTMAASNGTVGDSMAYDGASWSNKLGAYSSVSVAMHYIIGTAGLASNGAVVDIVSFNSAIYAAAGTQLYKWGGTVWATVGAVRGDTITDLQVFNDVLYIGMGDSTSYDTMSTGESYTNGTVPGRLFMQWNGFLYRAVENDVYYTGTTTWSVAIQVGPDDYSIRGMAPVGDDGNSVYLSTDEGLFMLLPGDFVTGVTPWPAHDTKNGRAIVHHQGDAFISSLNGLVRYTQGGQILSVGLEQGEGLPALRQGKIRSLVGLNNFLVACIEPTSANGMPTVWAWNHEGWHHLATLPAGIDAGTMLYDRSNSRLWIGTGEGLLAWLYVPDENDNPLRDATATYAPCAWVETDWFTGGLIEVQKDVESIYLGGDLAAGQKVIVYWQDDDSTDWEQLATFTRDRQEEVWTSTTRPNTRRIKLGLLLSTDGTTSTPRIDAVRMKYVASVNDRWRWQLPIRVAAKVEMLDRNYVARTAKEQREDLDVAIRSVAPVVYKDVDGSSYDVKVTASQDSIAKYEIVGEGSSYESIYFLSLLQVSADD